MHICEASTPSFRENSSRAFDLVLPPFVLAPEFTGLALKPKRWHCGRRSGGEGVATFAMKHIQPFRSQFLNTVPIHYPLAFRAIGIGNYR